MDLPRAAAGVEHNFVPRLPPAPGPAPKAPTGCPGAPANARWSGGTASGAAEYTPEVNNGILFYGEKETVFATDNRWVAIPKKGERRVIEARSDAGLLHMADFLEAVRSRRRPGCLPEDGFFSTATVQLAMISYRAGTMRPALPSWM